MHRASCVHFLGATTGHHEAKQKISGRNPTERATRRLTSMRVFFAT